MCVLQSVSHEHSALAEDLAIMVTPTVISLSATSGSDTYVELY